MLDTNKRILNRHFDEVLNEGRLDVIDEIYGDRYVLDAPVQTEGSVGAHGETRGRDGLKRRVVLFRTAFPDIHFTVDDMLAEGDRVAVQYTFSGTHTGQFVELEPTGRKINVTGILIALVNDDRIESALSVFDSGDMLHQLEPEYKSPIQHFIDSLVGRIRHGHLG
jgi:Predicted ester cyclase